LKIAVVGATGATGRSVLKRALSGEHDVIAVARRPERLNPAAWLSVVRGDVLSPGGLAGAFEGADAVTSCIGPDTNFSPGTLMSSGTANILAECKRARVRRFVMQSGINLTDGRELAWPNRLAVRIMRRIFAAAIADKAEAERMTQNSQLEWVILRPVVMWDRPAAGHYTAGVRARVAPLSPISFKDCADCLLRAAVGEPDWTGQILNVGR